MVVHPAPPADVPGFVEAYRQVLLSLVNTCDGLRESDWELPTDCPGWTVRDHVAHVVHLEDYLSGSEHPVVEDTIEVGSPEHVRNDLGVWMEQGVRSRAALTPEQLLTELRGLVEIRTADLYEGDLTLESTVRSVMGNEARFADLVRLRLCDLWIHEQDIRAAVDRPGSLDGPGAAQWTSVVLDAVPRVVLRRVAPDPGTVLIVESTGPVTGRAGVRIDVDEAGEPVAHELFTGHAAAEEEDDVPVEAGTEATTTISLSTHALARRTAGRTPTADTAYHVSGDEELAARVLDALTLTR
ncbi:maleylpyruvate isomerase family mycothiol-dependent enzyme [Serinicoccus kebangsaanensis]|uniref:maleylpyruvate isomerase family mycothiol-dependent enzyme n=1 Tax=Serinicoccus kebangsaanensis TaxID=2602069 RepID=UPI00124CDE9C|nr:maleylpyruvate isomerase family mycothiol-dependent enzyme [Serinicoccus kebangsaanensis]